MRLHYGGKSTTPMDPEPVIATARNPADPSGRSSLLGMLASKLIEGRNHQRFLKAQEHQFDQTGIIPS